MTGTEIAVPFNLDTLFRADDPLGTSFNFDFDGSHDLRSHFVWASGLTYDLSWATYDSRGNVLTVTNSVEEVQTLTYDQYNNVSSYTDAAGNTVRFHYTEPGQPKLLTQIVEPSDTSNPPTGPFADPTPQDQNPQGDFPVTRVADYVSNPRSEEHPS